MLGNIKTASMLAPDIKENDIALKTDTYVIVAEIAKCRKENVIDNACDQIGQVRCASRLHRQEKASAIYMGGRRLSSFSMTIASFIVVLLLQPYQQQTIAAIMG